MNNIINIIDHVSSYQDRSPYFRWFVFCRRNSEILPWIDHLSVVLQDIISLSVSGVCPDAGQVGAVRCWWSINLHGSHALYVSKLRALRPWKTVLNIKKDSMTNLGMQEIKPSTGDLYLGIERYLRINTVEGK